MIVSSLQFVGREQSLSSNKLAFFSYQTFLIIQQWRKHFIQAAGTGIQRFVSIFIGQQLHVEFSVTYDFYNCWKLFNFLLSVQHSTWSAITLANKSHVLQDINTVHWINTTESWKSYRHVKRIEPEINAEEALTF